MTARTFPREGITVADFGQESGSFGFAVNTKQSTTVSFGNTYEPDAVMVSASERGDTDTDLDADGTGAAVEGLTTDANGNVDGMTIGYGANENDDNRTVFWYVMGVQA